MGGFEAKQRRSDQDHEAVTSHSDTIAEQHDAGDAGNHARAGQALVKRLGDAQPSTGPVQLAPAILARLAASFGTLPAFEVIIDASKIPAGGRAASDGTHIYLHDASDAADVSLLAHEVAHIIQITGGHAAGGLDASTSMSASGELSSHTVEAHDETGAGRRSIEEEADQAAADVAAGRKIADLSTTPIAEGDVYLQETPGRVSAKSVHLVLFPGETTVKVGRRHITMGHLYVYVTGKLAASYEAAGGPPPGKGRADHGGHTIGDTPAGDYTLARAEHVTTSNWPMSVIPWGATLRERADHEIEYSSDGRNWQTATGIHGTVTRASILYEERDRAQAAATANKKHAGERGWKPVRPAPLTDDDKQKLVEGTRAAMNDSSGSLLTEWNQNDFGNWGFDMMSSGSRSPYFVHTTPEDEQATVEREADPSKPDVQLQNSHGCVHIKPADRADMMTRGFLQGGVKMTVKKYGVVGP